LHRLLPMWGTMTVFSLRRCSGSSIIVLRLCIGRPFALLWGKWIEAANLIQESAGMRSLCERGKQSRVQRQQTACKRKKGDTNDVVSLLLIGETDSAFTDRLNWLAAVRICRQSYPGIIPAEFS